MRIALVGVGAVGGYFGGRLAEAGAEVTFIARGETLLALQTTGLRVESPLGDMALPRVTATGTPAEVGVVDAVVVAVKAWQVPEVAEQIRPLVGQDTIILPLQNGVEAADQFAAVYGEHRVLGGTCAIIANKLSPAHIKHAGADPTIVLGELDNRPTQRVERLAHTLNTPGACAKISTDIQKSLWKKFLFIAPISGIAALARVPFGVLRSTPETRALIEEAMEEVHAVATARGVSLSREAIQDTLDLLDNFPAETTTSMQRDIMEGLPSELEATSGAVVRLGCKANVKTPVNRFVYAGLLPSETTARERAGVGGVSQA